MNTKKGAPHGAPFFYAGDVTSLRHHGLSPHKGCRHKLNFYRYRLSILFVLLAMFLARLFVLESEPFDPIL